MTARAFTSAGRFSPLGLLRLVQSFQLIAGQSPSFIIFHNYGLKSSSLKLKALFQGACCRIPLKRDDIHIIVGGGKREWHLAGSMLYASTPEASGARARVKPVNFRTETLPTFRAGATSLTFSRPFRAVNSATLGMGGQRRVVEAVRGAAPSHHLERSIGRQSIQQVLQTSRRRCSRYRASTPPRAPRRPAPSTSTRVRPTGA